MTSQIQLWEALLKLRRFQKTEREIIGWSMTKTDFNTHYTSSSLLSSDASVLLIRSKKAQLEYDQCKWNSVVLPFEDLILLHTNTISNGIVDMLKLYFPICVMHVYERVKPFVIVHVASSLDGKMATESGDSKWIGNKENLVHSHRLRALVDGVLVGAYTVKNDKPLLNVRHVKGENPIRLILSNRSKDFSGLKCTKGLKTFLVREECHKENEGQDIFDKIIYYSGANKKEKINNLMLRLYEVGIKTILIEGGSETISNVFNAEFVDVFQVHYAPIVLGSGKGIVRLPSIDLISEACSLKHSFWSQIGDSYMITAGL